MVVLGSLIDALWFLESVRCIKMAIVHDIAEGGNVYLWFAYFLVCFFYMVKFSAEMLKTLHINYGFLYLWHDQKLVSVPTRKRNSF